MLRFASSLVLLPCLAHAQFFVTPPLATPPDGAEILVHDPLRDRTVAFLGNATWEHDGFAWTPVATPVAPSDRYEFAMTFDGQRVLLYGGQSATGGALGDLWAYDGTWTLLGNAQAPGLRRAAALAFDRQRGRVVLFGGTDMLGGFPADTWEWDGATWTVSTATTPGARVWHRMVYDEARQRTVLCAGAMNPVTFVDTWEWDGATWSRTVQTTFPYCLAPALVFDQSTQRTLLVSGWETQWGYARNEVHAYDAANGTWNLVMNGTPTMQQFVGAAYDPARQRTVVLTGDPLWGPVASYYYRDQGLAGAIYAPFGAGCAVGGGGLPVLAGANGATPALGATFQVEVAPVGGAALAVLGVGWSRTTWQGVPLPVSLAPAGLTGCSLLVAPDALLPMTLQGTPAKAVLARTLPNVVALRGITFFEQALLLDASAPNGIGAVSSGAIGVVH
jgi:hypothetical protein